MRMGSRISAARKVGSRNMLNTVLVSVGMCLLGGEQVDISKYILPTSSLIELEVVMKPTGGELIIYSPGHEDKEARFSEADSFSTIPISGSILCIKALGGPFDFDLHVVAIRGVVG
jgi:hypothetical protein